jgi:2-dehydropantoate 2-reductase
VRFAIVGAGAIGGYLGGLLARSGEDVLLVARGPHLRAIQTQGLRVIAGDQEFTVHPNATDDLGAIRGCDVVVVTLKAHSLPPVARRLAGALAPNATVVSALNGIPWWYFQRHGGELEGLQLETVDPQGVIAAAIDPARIIGCVVYPAANLIEPGVVEHVEGDRFSLGELDGRDSERGAAIAGALTRCGLKAPITAKIREEIWVKLLGNAVFNPLSALTMATLGQIAESALTAAVVRGAMTEVVAVAKAVGVELPVSIDRRIRGAARVGAHKTSMLQDLEAGRPLEVDALTGSVVELADRVGVAAPVLRTIYGATKLLEAQRGSQIG